MRIGPPGTTGILPIDAVKPRQVADTVSTLTGMTLSFIRVDPSSAPPSADIEDLGHVRIAHLHGKIDAFTAPTLRDVLRYELVRRLGTLAVDLSDLTFLGVSGLYGLVTMRRAAQRGGPALVLTGAASTMVTRLLGLVGWTVTAGTPAASVGRDTSSLNPRGRPWRCVQPGPICCGAASPCADSPNPVFGRRRWAQAPDRLTAPRGHRAHCRRRPTHERRLHHDHRER
jgi:anti-anti-sigma factor